LWWEELKVNKVLHGRVVLGLIVSTRERERQAKVYSLRIGTSGFKLCAVVNTYFGLIKCEKFIF
jgi:hypothetical protein